MRMSDLHLAKIAAIQRSVTRARQELTAAGEHFVTDLTRQDAALLNVLRACESALDHANVLIRERQLGIPQSSRDSFRLLLEARVIPADVALKLQKMVGFGVTRKPPRRSSRRCPPPCVQQAASMPSIVCSQRCDHRSSAPPPFGPSMSCERKQA